jgi:methyl-accepting chemotaxis protein
MVAFGLDNPARRSIQLRGKILLLFGISTFLLLAAAAVGFWEFNVDLQAFEEVRLSQNNAIDVEATESDFKKQVQEWKDTLLRGKKPEALTQYWGNFEQRERQVGDEAERLSHNISEPEAAQLVMQFIAAHKSMGDAYRRGLQQFKDHQFDSAAGDAAVAGMDRAPTDLLTKAKERLVSQASARATEVKEHAYRAIRASVALLMAAAALGVLVFLVAVQRGISKPLVRLNGAMLEMVGGSLDIVIPGMDRRDEIGSMANAVSVFRENLVRNARLEAEKGQAEKRAAAEREAAMQKMASDFEAAIGGIVEAAIAGDFSQRVALEGKSGLVLNVGTSINCLCDNIANALDDLAVMLGALSQGDMTRRITADYHGQFATLKENANATAQGIGSTISQIKQSAREVSNASAEISTSTTDLSQRTEEQAASLEETSASMEEISATVKKNAENAQHANQSAVATQGVADRGGQVVAKAVKAMARIEDSSRKISDIIGVIDEIARQTNLLALNAAVEAARAGEAGRGFAVVASEVRSLAQRSSQAAKDIKDLITNSNGQVKEGVELVNEAGTALTEIVAAIKGVTQIVADIASASAEQSTGIEQVNKALAQMDEVTQQNSALVEENAATAKTLEHQSSAMDERVGFFRIDDTDQKPSRPAGTASRPAAAVRPSPKRVAAANGAARRPAVAGNTALKESPDWKEF